MTQPTHDELKELTGGYVLGILTAAERAALEAHLPTCSECTREIRDLLGVTTGLALAVPQVDPPAALRERVLRSATGSVATPTATPKAERNRPLPAWLAIAASIAAVALGLYTLTLRDRIETLQSQLREANVRAEGVERQLQIARTSTDRAIQIASILEAPDVRRIDLAGQKTAPGAAGRAFWSPTRGLVFTATNLPAAASGRQYQLWVIPPGGKPVSAGLLNLEDAGRTRALVDPSTAAQVGAVAVSIEPAGGVPQPTGDIVLLGAL